MRAEREINDGEKNTKFKFKLSIYGKTITIRVKTKIYL